MATATAIVVATAIATDRIDRFFRIRNEPKRNEIQFDSSSNSNLSRVPHLRHENCANSSLTTTTTKLATATITTTTTETATATATTTTVNKTVLLPFYFHAFSPKKKSINKQKWE